MTIIHLVKSLASRGFIIGLVFGLVSGFGYILIVIGLVQISNALFPQPPMNDGGLFYMPFLISLLVALFGIAVNSICGLVTGFAIAILTRAYFVPLVNAPEYRAIASKVCIILGIMCGAIGFSLALGEFYGGFERIPQSALPVLFVFVIAIPTLVTVAGAMINAKQMVNWYERESAKGIAQNVSSN